MKIDGDTILPTANGQTVGHIARRIVAAIVPVTQAIDDGTAGMVQEALCRVWLAGYQSGVSDESHRGTERHD